LSYGQKLKNCFDLSASPAVLAETEGGSVFGYFSLGPVLGLWGAAAPLFRILALKRGPRIALERRFFGRVMFTSSFARGLFSACQKIAKNTC